MPACPNGESGGTPSPALVALPTPGGVIFDEGGDAGAPDEGGFFAPSNPIVALLRPSVIIDSGSLAAIKIQLFQSSIEYVFIVLSGD